MALGALGFGAGDGRPQSSSRLQPYWRVGDWPLVSNKECMCVLLNISSTWGDSTMDSTEGYLNLGPQYTIAYPRSSWLHVWVKRLDRNILNNLLDPMEADAF